MIRNKKAISICITIIMGVIMAFVTLHSLWVTIPFLLCMIMNFSDDCDLCTAGFAIALDIFAFCTNIWFGIAFFILATTILLVLLCDRTDNSAKYACILCIILFDIGTAICGELGILLYVIPSIVAILVVLLGVENGMVEKIVMSNSSVENQISILESRVKEQSYNGDFYGDAETMQRLKDLRFKKGRLDAQTELQQFRKKYVTEDMERIEKLLGIGKYSVENIIQGRFTINDEVFNNQSIPRKIKVLQNFNAKLQNNINENISKANGAIWDAYKSVLQNVSMNMNDYFWNYSNIYQRYSSALNNPVLAAACDKSVKKIADFVQQKQDIINKNNADIEKYNQLIQRLQKQYDDELALQKIKELNRDVNSQMDDISDIAQKEEKNFEIQNIMSDIDQLDREINERRHLEIQFGQIEI